MQVSKYAVEVDSLTYRFPDSSAAALEQITLNLPWNSRTLLVGANGAGKSTLLKLLGGKHLTLGGRIRVAGLDPFSARSVLAGTEEAERCQLTVYLGTEWCHNSVVARDIGVQELLDSVGFDHFRARGENLVRILDVDVNWRMHKLSDGQRRRVQLVMGLLEPFRVLLLDEVTVDLDVVARGRLLEFLRQETETRTCAVVYATHIFDGLAHWPDRVVHIRDARIVDDLDCHTDIIFSTLIPDGTVEFQDTSKAVDVVPVQVGKASTLHPLALEWLRVDTNVSQEEL